MAKDRLPTESGRKRKQNNHIGSRKQAKTTKTTTPATQNDEEISGVSSSEDDEFGSNGSETENIEENSELSSDEEFAAESAADKRRRLAKQYLENLKENEFGDDDFNAQDLDDDIVSRRLQVDVAEGKGFIYKFLGDKLEAQINEVNAISTRIGSKNVTGVSVRYPHLYTVSKDMELVKWDVEKKPQRVKHTRGGRKHINLRREQHMNHHYDQINCVAVSPDGKYVVTGGADGRLIIWSSENLVCLKVLEVRSSINSITFRRGTDQLYAACSDLRIRTYSINQFAQLEVLYGHQDTITDISSLARETCVSVGARDKMAMFWKISEESRLTFRGGDSMEKKRKNEETPMYAEGSIEVVSMNDESHFVTGSDNGNVSLWSLAKKKPLSTHRIAHGIQPQLTPEQASGETHPEASLVVPQPQPYWITAVYAVPYSDIFVTGSYDGAIRVWRIERETMRTFKLVGSVAVRGCVVGFDSVELKGKLIIYAVLSKEHKYGRWIKVAGRNSLVSIAFDI
ncbi:hypothetical protein PGUG_05431 [Meyerozyma guilliermondii ATCC 6260]|uniref:Ribosomal RNA-processing protein 9 n=1 Tax=Meyerozyma guilliermondii (strain ATCC 6260 / CBS 566 / DSM 6381 / JCM 1539 / NBRC 10279 / NRRL Y-324) TaxID=294746 RepID=A5DQ80_PICGU|nr:uncharacterized protein PGUG_05431 [Meyerozyma guilliermondii ATCC 6260]EDK41333.2 hypothetical protein PGUG_05431 [Meyerozyma guilliermondii ATCC 6260]